MKIRRLNEDEFSNDLMYNQNGLDSPDTGDELLKVQQDHYNSVLGCQEKYENAFNQYKKAKNEKQKSDAVDKADNAVAGALNIVSGKNVGSELLNNSHDPGFLTRWIQSMKWTELKNRNNEFVKTLKLNDKNNLLKNKNSFIKIYNKYANELYETTKFNDVSEINQVKDSYTLNVPGEAEKEVTKLINSCKQSKDGNTRVFGGELETALNKVKNETNRKQKSSKK